MSIFRRKTSATDKNDPFALYPEATAFYRKTWPHALPAVALAERATAESPLQIVAHCRPSPPVAGLGPLKRRAGRKKAAATFFYTSFTYAEAGAAKTCTREELCAAYATLVADYGDLRAATHTVVETLDRLPLASGRAQTPEERVAFEAQVWTRLVALRKRCEAAQKRLRKALYHYQTYLARLSRGEDEGHKRPPWLSYPPLLFSFSVVRFPHKTPTSLPDTDEMEDFVFRAAKLINASETPAEVVALHRELRDMGAEILKRKGYTPESLDEYFPDPDREEEKADAKSALESTGRVDDPVPPYDA